MGQSRPRLARRERRQPVESLDLETIQARFMTYQRACNHSPKQLTHYACTFRDFARFLHETGREPVPTTLKTPTFEAFVVWLRETPLGRPYRGTTQRTESGIWGHMKDL